MRKSEKIMDTGAKENIKPIVSSSSNSVTFCGLVIGKCIKHI